jgi:hypothetical protein
MGKSSRDLEHPHTSIRDYCRAVALKDWREIGDDRLKIHFIFEWFGADEGIHVGCEYCARPPLMVDCGHGILFRVHAKWVHKAWRLTKLGRSPRLGGFATSILSVS